MPHTVGPRYDIFSGTVSGIASRWVIGQEHVVGPADLDAGGAVSDAAVERWAAAVLEAYLDRCARLPRAAVRRRAGTMPRGALLGRPADVYITASVKEFRPASFTVGVRMRPGGGDVETPVNAAWVVTLVDERTGELVELGDDVRDELIALEHAAAYMN